MRLFVIYLTVAVNMLRGLASSEKAFKVYEGDLLLSEEHYAALKSPKQSRGFTPARQWPNGVVPFVVGPGIASSTAAKGAVISAMKEWTSISCVVFLPRTNEKEYIEFVKDDKNRCGSTGVGYWPGGHYKVLLAERCWWHGMVLHELGHVIGFMHEHTRPDRDKYVTVIEKNIKEGRRTDFFKGFGNLFSYVTPYDYSSVMHYGDTFASKNGGKTLVPTKSGATIGNWDKLSEIDIKQLNLFYNCPPGSAWFRKTICEDSVDTIECYGGRSVQVLHAGYGRYEWTTCGFGFPVKCEMENVQEKVKSMCDGKSACVLQASDSVFGGDPCWGMSEYLRVLYKCVL